MAINSGWRAVSRDLSLFAEVDHETSDVWVGSSNTRKAHCGHVAYR